MSKKTWIQLLIIGWVGGWVIAFGLPVGKFLLIELPLIVGLVYMPEEEG